MEHNDVVREVVARVGAKGISSGAISAEMFLSSDLGIDSLQFIRVILELEAKLDRKIFSVELIAKIKTFADLCAAVAA
jgi:acyl carrier protein